MNKKEIFKPIPQLEGRWELSNLARIRNVKTGKILVGTSAVPYPQLTISQGKTVRFKLIKVMSDLFLPEIKQKGMNPQLINEDLPPTADNIKWVPKPKKESKAKPPKILKAEYAKVETDITHLNRNVKNISVEESLASIRRLRDTTDITHLNRNWCYKKEEEAQNE